MRNTVSDRRHVLWIALAAALAAHAPRPARACGGFFCNQPTGSNLLPVAQTGENVLFSMERAPSGQFQLEAHVQIFYAGPADRFSWIVPVDSKPELDVGANQIFTALQRATQPSFNLQWREEGVCRVPPGPGGGGSGGASSAPRPPSGADAASAAADAGVSISFHGEVGPYDAVVIRSTDPRDPKPLIDWLNENKYYISPEADRLIRDYVQQEKYFVAIRLLNDHSVSEIEPLVMRFQGPGPCIPLKLTSIAAIRDLRVNLWVLAPSRVVPENYYELILNEARLDWLAGGRNYEDLIKRAADEAGGNAFLTEFVGPTTVLTSVLDQMGTLSVEPIRRAATPPDALDLIANLGFPRDSQLLGILRMFIPEPAALKAMNIPETQFYNLLRMYYATYRQQFAPFDAAGLAAALEARYITPLRKARLLANRSIKLTRLATFISPEEMNLDPTFVLNPTLSDVPAVHTATATRVCGDQRYTRCDAPVRLELASGELIWFKPAPQPVCYGYGQAYAYERDDIDGMPALARAWQRTTIGEGMMRFDNQIAIRNAIKAHNDAVSKALATPPLPPPPPPDAGGGGSPGGSQDGGADVQADAGAPGRKGGTPGAQGGGGGEGSGGAGGDEVARSQGCACATPGVQGGRGGLALPLGLGAGLLIARRRRRQRG
jgi:MYXO-CTERM domain-containing protein